MLTSAPLVPLRRDSGNEHKIEKGPNDVEQGNHDDPDNAIAIREPLVEATVDQRPDPHSIENENQRNDDQLLDTGNAKGKQGKKGIQWEHLVIVGFPRFHQSYETRASIRPFLFPARTPGEPHCP